MGIDTHIASSSRKTLAFSIWNMLLCLRISVLLGHTKVDQENIVGGLSAWLADQKVVWLDITVNEIMVVNGLNTSQLYEIGQWPLIFSWRVLRKQGWVGKRIFGDIYHVFSKHSDGFNRKLASAHIKHIFQAWTKEINDQNIVKTFLTKVVGIGYASCWR